MGTPIAAQAGRLVPNAIKICRFYAGQAYGALKGESWPIDDEEGAYRVCIPFPFPSTHRNERQKNGEWELIGR